MGGDPLGAGLIYGCLAPHPPILVPAVAGRRVEQVRQTRDAVERVAREIQGLSPDALVLVSPHAPLSPHSMGLVAAGGYRGSFDAFGAPSATLEVPADPEMAVAIESHCRALGVPVSLMGKADRIHRLDHGAAVPLYFFAEAGVRCKLVLATFSALGTDVHLRFGRAIAAAANASRKRVVLVASGDLSHRLTPDAPAGYSPRGREFDNALVAALREGDRKAILELDEGLLREAGECGYRSLVIALGALPESQVEVLSYEGPFGVGYLVARFYGEAIGQMDGSSSAVTTASLEPRHEETAVLGLAKRAVETYVREGRVLEIPADPEGLLADRAGVFVSLKMHGDLRGCIGTFEPTERNIAAEIIRNGIAAATRDPRFLPVAREELPYLRYSVDILSRPEPVESERQLDPKKYGVIVQAGSRRGLLLPDLEGVSTVQEQLSIARRKAGIPLGVPVQLYRFTVRRIGEPKS